MPVKVTNQRQVALVWGFYVKATYGYGNYPNPAISESVY